MDRCGQHSEHHGDQQRAGDGVPVPAANHENCRGERREQRPADEHGSERCELAAMPRAHRKEQQTEAGDRGHAFAHVVVHGLGGKSEHQPAEPSLPGLFRGLSPPPPEAHDPMMVQSTHHPLDGPKYP